MLSSCPADTFAVCIRAGVPACGELWWMRKCRHTMQSAGETRGQRQRKMFIFAFFLSGYKSDFISRES